MKTARLLGEGVKVAAYGDRVECSQFFEPLWDGGGRDAMQVNDRGGCGNVTEQLVERLREVVQRRPVRW